jgi:hypothetical protein
MPRRFGAAAAVLGAAAAPVAVAQPALADSSGSHCSTRALSPTQLDAGELSEIRCFATFAESLAAIGVEAPAGLSPADAEGVAALSAVLAVHYDGNFGTGASLAIGGSDCNGGGISFSAGDPWNDVISSTEHRLCGRVKHWVDANYSGSYQNTQGGYGAVVNMNATLTNKVSSIKYYTPLN